MKGPQTRSSSNSPSARVVPEGSDSNDDIGAREEERVGRRRRREGDSALDELRRLLEERSRVLEGAGNEKFLSAQTLATVEDTFAEALAIFDELESGNLDGETFESPVVVELAEPWAHLSCLFIATKARALRHRVRSLLEHCLRWKPTTTSRLVLKALVHRPMEIIMGPYSAAVRLTSELLRSHIQAFTRGFAALIVSSSSSPPSPPTSPVPKYSHGLGFNPKTESSASAGTGREVPSLVPLPSSPLESSLLLLSHVLAPEVTIQSSSLALMLIDSICRALGGVHSSFRPQKPVSSLSLALGLQCIIDLIPVAGMGLRDQLDSFMNVLLSALQNCSEQQDFLPSSGATLAGPPFPTTFALTPAPPSDVVRSFGVDGELLLDAALGPGTYRLKWPGLPYSSHCEVEESVIPAGSRIARLEACMDEDNSTFIGMRLWASDLEGRLEPLPWIGTPPSVLERTSGNAAHLQSVQLQLSQGEYCVAVEACAGSDGTLVAIRLITTHQQCPWLGYEDQTQHSLLFRGHRSQGVCNPNYWDEITGISAVVDKSSSGGALRDFGVALCPPAYNPVITSDVLAQPQQTLYSLVVRTLKVCYALFPRNLLALFADNPMVASTTSEALSSFRLHPELCGTQPAGAWFTLSPEELHLYVRSFLTTPKQEDCLSMALSDKLLKSSHVAKLNRDNDSKTLLNVKSRITASLSGIRGPQRRSWSRSNSSSSASDGGGFQNDSLLESDTSSDEESTSVTLERHNVPMWWRYTTAAPDSSASQSSIVARRAEKGKGAILAANDPRRSGGAAAGGGDMPYFTRRLMLLSSELIAERSLRRNLEDELKAIRRQYSLLVRNGLAEGVSQGVKVPTATGYATDSSFISGLSEIEREEIRLSKGAALYFSSSADILREKAINLARLRATSARHRDALLEAEEEKRKWLRALQKQLATESTIRQALSEDNSELREELNVKDLKIEELGRQLRVLSDQSIVAKGKRVQIEQLQTQLAETSTALKARTLEVESLRAAVPKAVASLVVKVAARNGTLAMPAVIRDRLEKARSSSTSNMPESHLLERIAILEAELGEARSSLEESQLSAQRAAQIAEEQLSAAMHKYRVLVQHTNALNEQILFGSAQPSAREGSDVTPL